MFVFKRGIKSSFVKILILFVSNKLNQLARLQERFFLFCSKNVHVVNKRYLAIKTNNKIS